MKIKTIDDLSILKQTGLDSLYPEKIKITVGMATCGIATGAKKVYDALLQEISEKGWEFILTQTGCIGFCQKEPIIDILEPRRPRIYYREMTPEKAIELLQDFRKGEIKKEWALCRRDWEENLLEGKRRPYASMESLKEMDGVPLYEDIPFYKKQMKIALRNCGFIDPENIEQYIAKRGYLALYKVLKEIEGKGRGWFPNWREMGIML
jgi:(2Fe-2S) ferredoxin